MLAGVKGASFRGEGIVGWVGVAVRISLRRRVLMDEV